MNKVGSNLLKKVVSQDLIFGAPKVELHAHLNGSVRKSTLFEIAERKSVEVDYSMFEKRNIEGGFKIFTLIHQVLKDLPDIRRVSREVLEDFRDQNVAYLELRTTPKSCEFGTYSKEEYLSAVIEEIEEFQRDFGHKMQTRLLVSIDRGRSVEDAQQTFDLLLKYRNLPLIIGLDYSGNPTKNTFHDYIQFFDAARKAGLKTTVHVAELEGEVCLKESQDILNFVPDRLGHFNYFDKNLYDQVRKLQIPIEMCPTSNFYTMGMKQLNEHHFKDFFYHGHTLNINTDDTCVFDTDITLEHHKVAEAFNISTEQFEDLLMRSASMIFDDSFKPVLQQKIQEYFATIKKE